MRERDVLEVETPVLSRAGNTDPNIESLCAHHGDDQIGWLRTSPEFPMKRLLAAGYSDIYELAKVFRACEQGRKHNPEFTMLEWYRSRYTYRDLAKETAELIVGALALVGRNVEVSEVSYASLFDQLLGIDVLHCSDEELQELVQSRNWYQGPLDRTACLDIAFSLGIEPQLPRDKITLVYGYPACQAALAKLHADGHTAQRFEVFLGTTELANGYGELDGSDAVAKRLHDENQTRETRGQQTMPVDQNLIAAAATGWPGVAGVALGIDRLLMAMLNVNHINDVIAFPSERA